MSSSIRPPTGSPAPTGLGEAADVAGSREAQDVAASRQVGDVAGGREVAASQAASGARTDAATGSTASWLARLDAREVTRSEAIDGIVADAVEAHGGARLAPAQRQELAGILRAALLDDPVLGQLLGVP